MLKRLFLGEQWNAEQASALTSFLMRLRFWGWAGRTWAIGIVRYPPAPAEEVRE